MVPSIRRAAPALVLPLNLGPITFLAPLAGAVAAGVALPALLLWYFLKLRRRPVRVSSTFLWKSAAADLQVNVPFRWIRASWLLLLQLLILLALIAAIGRPAVEGAGGPGARVVLMIDRSASMSARDGAAASNGERRMRLDEAKERALHIIDRMGDGAEGMVVSIAARPEALVNLTRNRAELRRAVESITPTDQPGDLHAALRMLSNTALRDESEGGARPRVVLVSDGAFEGRSFGGGPGASGGSGLGRAEFQFVRVGPAAPVASGGEPPPLASRDNLGIVALAARRGYEDPSSVTLFLRVQNAGTEAVDAAATVRLGGRQIEARSLRIPAATADGPGEQPLRIEFQDSDGGVLSVALGRPDLLAADDTAGLFLRPPQGAAILVVQPNIPSAVTDFLPIDALQSLAPRALLPVTFAEYERMIAGADGSRPIRDFNLVVFDRVRPSVLPPLPSLSFGASVPIPGLGVIRPGEGDPAGAPTGFAFWQRSHPILRYVNLGVVNIAAPMKVTVPDAGAARDGPPLRTEVLASGSSGPLIVLAEQAGIRRVIVGFELADSQWWQDPGFPVFIKNVVDHLTLTGDESVGRALTTIETASVRPLAEALAVEVTGPADVVRRRDEGGWTGAVSLGPFQLAGLYTATGVVAEDAALAVNMLDPFESRLETRNEVLLGGRSVATSTAGLGGLREMWHWFIAAAACLLAVEWLVYVWRMRV